MVQANYVYDGLERLAIRTTQNMTPSGTTHYLYDLQGRILSEATSSGTIQTEYVWVDDLPLALFANLDTISPQQWYVHPDHLNRPVRMTDSSETLVWDAVYGPFGAVYSVTGSATNNLRFPGQYFLLEAGLHYNWYRHYDPTLGRYTQPDPFAIMLPDAMVPVPVSDPSVAIAPYQNIVVDSTSSLMGGAGVLMDSYISSASLGFPDGPSLYTYAASAPTMKVDPTGRNVVAIPIAFCLRYPSLCAAIVTSGVNACVQTYKYLAGKDKRDNCDYQYYEVDIPTCRAIANNRGKAAGARCYASAMERYAACIAGRPMPPLDTWNN